MGIMSVTRVKGLFPGMDKEHPNWGNGKGNAFDKPGEIQFIVDSRCEDYDWLVVYDDIPKHDSGTVRKEMESLVCPPEQTVLITAEPPTIRIYPECYTRQFGYVLTTHDELYLPHRHYRRGRGCLQWLAGYGNEEAVRMPEYPKSKTLSTVCSSKMMKHTQHFKSYNLTQYLSQHLPEMEWFGYGVRPLSCKADALSDYRYHIAVENYIHPYHWTDKISDPLLGLCLTFYAGDPCLQEIFPPESFVPIPIDDPPAALEIIRKAIRDNEYDKRLPAIREARRLLVTKYNMYEQVVDLIRNHSGHASRPLSPTFIRGRHRLRKNPLNALEEFSKLVRFRVLQRTR